MSRHTQSRFPEALKPPIVRLAGAADRPVDAPSHGRPIVRRPLHADQPVTFGSSGNAATYLVEGDWHVPEERHRWAQRPACLMVFNPLFRDAVTLIIDLQVMPQRPWADLDLAITLNGIVLPVRRDSENDTIRMKVDGLLKDLHEANLLIFYSKLARVSEIVDVLDSRLIGVGVQQVCFATDD